MSVDEPDPDNHQEEEGKEVQVIYAQQQDKLRGQMQKDRLKVEMLN